jgi:hypothetical protein
MDNSEERRGQEGEKDLRVRLVRFNRNFSHE